MRKTVEKKVTICDSVVREIVDQEVELAKVVSVRKQVGLENETLRMKLAKLTDLSDSKILEL